MLCLVIIDLMVEMMSLKFLLVVIVVVFIIKVMFNFGNFDVVGKNK